MKLDKLNSTKSPGPDGIHPRVLKELTSVVSDPLADIMNESISEGILPNSWKEAHVSPVYKKGVKSNLGNYRPVSLTSVVCKVLESLICDHLMEYMTSNDLLSVCQHGFMNGKSCSTQLLLSGDLDTPAGRGVLP